jgi:hypothetical protein
LLKYIAACWIYLSIVYVTVNGIPSVLWKTRADPANVNEPVLMGVLVTVTGVLENVVIVERAMHVTLSSIWRCMALHVLRQELLWIVLMFNLYSIGLLAVNITVPVQIFPLSMEEQLLFDETHSVYLPVHLGKILT